MPGTTVPAQQRQDASNTAADQAAPLEPEGRPRTRIPWVLMVVAASAATLRFVLAALSSGSNDVVIWSRHATNILEHGLSWTYANSTIFNHPPLMGLWALACRTVFANHFSFMLKVPGIAGEVLSCVLIGLIWRARMGDRAGAWAAVAYACAPVMVIVSGFHGNTDALFAALSLLAAWALADRKSPFLAGLALGAALNVKLIPGMLVVPLLLQCRTRREALRYLSGLALMAIPYVPFLLTVPGEMYRNMFQYNSNPEHWGMTFFVLQGQATRNLAPYANDLLPVWLAAGRYVVLFGPILLGLWARRERWNAYTLVAASYMLFLVAAPGFGIQYLAALPPVLFACTVRRGFGWSALAGVFAAVLYFSFFVPNSYPWRSIFTSRYPMAAALVGVVLWAWTLQGLLAPRRWLSVSRSQQDDPAPVAPQPDRA